MTIKELFGHAIGVVKFGDIAKFYNWFTKQDHTLKGDITFEGDVDLADATVTGLPDSRPYKVYSALLSQTGTSAPTSVILENTFPSAIVWAFSSAGSFVGTLTAAFVENKTQCWIEQSSTDTAPGTSFKRIVRTGANTVQIDCSDVEGNPLNDVIVDTPIEIRVYN